MTIFLNNKTGFAAIPNSCAQSKELSFEAIGLCTFLQSLPSGWKIMPWWIQKEKNIGRKKWNKLAKELIEYGCLKLKKGAHICGSYYVFDLWDSGDTEMERSIQNGSAALEKCREPLLGTVAFGDCRKKGPHINKQFNKKETVKTNNKEGVVDLKNMDFLLSIGIPRHAIETLVDIYGSERFEKASKMLKDEISKSIPIRNPMAWLHTALDKNWSPKDVKENRTHRTPEETLVFLDERDQYNNIKKISAEHKRKSLKDFIRHPDTKVKSIEA